MEPADVRVLSRRITEGERIRVTSGGCPAIYIEISGGVGILKGPRVAVSDLIGELGGVKEVAAKVVVHDDLERSPLLIGLDTRDLPIAADYVGKYVDTLDSQRVLVELEAQGHKQSRIWLVNKE